MHFIYQRAHIVAIEVTTRHFRVRISRALRAVQRAQAGGFVFTPMRIVNAKPLRGRARLHAATIDFHHHGGRRYLDRRGQLAAAIERDLFVSLACQLRADLLGQAAHVPAGDVQLREPTQIRFALAKRFGIAARKDDVGKHRWRVAMIVQAQLQSRGGKRLADRTSIHRPVHRIR